MRLKIRTWGRGHTLHVHHHRIALHILRTGKGKKTSRSRGQERTESNKFRSRHASGCSVLCVTERRGRRGTPFDA